MSTAQKLSRHRISSLAWRKTVLLIIGVDRLLPETQISTYLHRKHLQTGAWSGYGLFRAIDGNLVYVYSQDVSVLNGTIGEMHAKKIANIYALAMKTGAPVIGLIDCAGVRLQEATDALNGFGQIYMSQTMASGVVPQITGIFGTLRRGIALWFPALTDFTFHGEKKQNYL